MYNTYITSAITLRTRGSFPVSFNDYSSCSNDRNPFVYSSSRTPYCCSCCANSVYRMPVNPGYCCDLYGSRQSSLIQCRKLGLGGFDRCYYSRLPVCDVDRRCYCDRVCDYREKSVCGQRVRLRKCLVIEETSASYEVEGVDEADALLSLLTEDIDEECFHARKEIKRLVKKPLVEKKENSGSKKKRFDLGVSESETRFDYELAVSSSMGNGRRERGKKEQEREALLKIENRKSRMQDEKREVLMRKASEMRCDYDLAVSSSRKRENIRGERSKKEEERESLLNMENREARMRDEKREALLRKASEKTVERQERKSIMRNKASEEEELVKRDEHRHRVRKDGSSCSSYYSFSSTGDYESDNCVEHNEGDSSIGYKSNVRVNEVDYEKGAKVDQRREDYKEAIGVSLTKKSNAQESRASSSVVESDFRNKSEKKLTDISIDEKESRKGTMQKDSRLSTLQESDYGKSSDSYSNYENRKAKSTGSNILDVEKKQQNRQTHDEVLRQSEQKMKYKQLVETGIDDVRMQKKYSNKDDMPDRVTRSSQEAVGEYQKNSRKVSEVSNIIDVDFRKTNISRQELETDVKTKKDYSNNTLTSAYDVEKKHHYEEGKFQQLTKRESTSILKKQSDSRFTEQEESVNLVYGSSSVGSDERQSETHTDYIKNEDSRDSEIVLEEHNKTKSGMVMKSSSLNLGTSDVVSDDSTSRITTESFKEREDAIGSASRLQKSSSHYVGEFVDKVRHEISSSELHKEKKASEEQKEQQSLIQYSSGDSESKSSGIKGPSDEIWKLDEPVVGELSKEEVQKDPNNAGITIVKRSGRSLWNVIGDIVLLRWKSETRSTGGKTGSPNQSTSTETWFSGHEAEENEEATEEKESKSIIQEAVSVKEEKKRSQFEESSTSSTLEGRLKNAEVSAPSSSVVLETSRRNSGKTSSTDAILESSTLLPMLRLQRSPVVRSVSQDEEANISDSGLSEPISSGSMEQLEVNEGGLKRGKLRRKDQMIKDRFDELEETYVIEAEQRKLDELFMREALLEAQKAGDKWEVPVGAVLVHNGNIIARGCNLVEELRDSTAHAEMMCIREASNVLRSWRLSETTLYVTLEPCPMCAGAILQARIDTVVWGAPNKLLGADGSWIRLFPNGNGGNELEQTDTPAAPIHPFHPKITIRRGVLASECADTMKEFFQLRRKKKERKSTESSSTSSKPAATRVRVSHQPTKLLKKMHDAFMFCLLSG